MSSRFEGRVAVITGAASGMGLAIAKRFASEGASVVLGDLDAESGEAAAQSIVDQKGKALFVRTDVTRFQDALNLARTAVDRFGRLDFAANMAGIAMAGGLFIGHERRDLVMAVNLTGTFNCVEAQVAAMRQGGGGVIVNCSSVNGLRGSAVSPYYTAAKHGVIGFSKSAALELAAERIRVNVICPGLTHSRMSAEQFDGKLDELAGMMPIGRIGQPEDQANAVVWLCSDEASFVTGAVFSIDGGQMAGSPAGSPLALRAAKPK